MAKIRVDTTGVAELRSVVGNVNAHAGSAQAFISQARNGMDMKTAASENVNCRINNLYSRLRAQQEKLRQYETALENVNERFLASDRIVANQAKGINYLAKQIVDSPYTATRESLKITAQIGMFENLVCIFSGVDFDKKLLPKGVTTNFLLSYILPGKSGFDSVDHRKNESINTEIIEGIKTISKYQDKLMDQDEWGVLEKFLTFVQSFTGFFSGEKKGITGISDWLQLSDDSIELWTELYDYFRKMYKDQSHLFGDKVWKDSLGLNVFADFLGLLAALSSATDGLEEKSGMTAFADYLDCLKKLTSISESGYKLTHFKDAESLAEIKGGPWSALDVYKAIINSTIGSISQGVRSVEKYYADGQWDAGDTGATGIDVAMAGLYGLSHELTFGLDDFVFGLVDRASGGNGTADMSYIEKAAEGYKILAEMAGEALGDLWIKITR